MLLWQVAPVAGDSAWMWVAGVMAAILVPGGTGAFLYMKGQIDKLAGQIVTERTEAQKREDAIRRECAERIAKYEVKLDESSEMVLKQAESQIAQVAALQQTVQTLQTLLDTKGVAK